MKYYVRVSIILSVLLCLMAPAELFAQQRNGRRLSEHERRIREIIQQRREEQMEREREQAARERQQLIDDTREAIQSGETPPGGPNAQQNQLDAQPEERKRVLSSVVMGFKFLNEDGVLSYNTIVQEGETFVTEVILFNIDTNPIDEIRLALDYDKRFIEPVKVFDTELRPLIDGAPNFRISSRDSMVIYEAALKKPLAAAESVLLRILWEAKRETAYTGIEFAFAPTEEEDRIHTGIYSNGKNILGFGDDPADGVLSGGVMIERFGGEERILQGKAEELRELYLGTGAAQAETGLVLIGPERPPKVGEEFVVKVGLNNPEGALIDALSFFITFDPEKLQVLDTERFNWISRGVNILDGPYHEDYPWDMHRRNEVRNERGYIHYAMSLSNGQSLPSGILAEIHFMPIAPTMEAEVGFVKGRPGAPELSSIRYFGFELLDLKTQISRPLLKFPIQPNARDIAMENETQESEAAEAEEVGVRSLKIVRD